MSAQKQLKICAYLLSLLGLWSVTATEHFSYVWPIVAPIAVMASWFYEGPGNKPVVYRRIWMALGICMLIFFPFDMAFSGNLLLPAIHISIFAQAYLLFNPKNLRIYSRIFLISFAQLLASTNLTTDIVFAIILVAYCITAVYGIILLRLLGDLKSSGPADAAGRKAPPALLISSFFLSLLLLPPTMGFFYAAPRLQYALIAGTRSAEAVKRMEQARARTGFTKTVRLGTFGRIQQDQTLALRVEILDDSPALGRVRKWRGGALNIYDGMTWSSSRDYFVYFNGEKWDRGSRNFGMVNWRGNDLFIVDERFARYSSTEQLDADPRLEKQTVYLEIPYSEHIFGAKKIRAVQGPFTFRMDRDFNGSLAIRNRQALPEFISYTVYSEIYEPSAEELRRVPHEKFRELIEDGRSGDYNRIHFLQVPVSLDPRIRRLAFEITEDAPTPYDKVDAIQNFLETQFTYSLDLGRPILEDPLNNFLFVSRSGHCEYFATAMTLMTRIVGIPARLVKGFQKGRWNDAGRFYEVRQRDAHAWVEVYFPGHGWVAFDPSPRAVADEYFERRRSPIVRAISRRFLMMQIQWRKYVVGYNQSRRLKLLAGIKGMLREAPNTAAGIVRRSIGKAWDLAVSNSAGVMLTTLLLVAAYFAHRKNLFPAFLRWPLLRPGRRRNGAAFYERMLGVLEKRKITKPAWVTSNEFLEYPILRGHPMFSEIEALTSIYNRVRFGNQALSRDETTLINNALRRLRRSYTQARPGAPAEKNPGT